ncbi:acyl carrier protein [Saccharothrix stipae]
MELTVNERILEVFAAKAEVPIAELNLDHTFEEIGLDSLHLMEVALWMHKEFGAVIPEGDLHHEQTVREALAYLDAQTR